MNDLVESIRERYLFTLDKIAEAARMSGRLAESVKLVVVTKSQPLEVARAAIQAGVKLLGENYPEEGVAKIQSLAGNSAVEWHIIGHVQSRKAAIVAQNFNYMHSLDSLKLAERLNRFCGEAGRILPVLLEFNTGDEESKSGWRAANESRWSDFHGDIESILSLPNLKVGGLMTMPPLGATPDLSRPYFQKLRKLQERLQSHFPQANWTELSMGTSMDYEAAIQEGATFVRVGTAIVGSRINK